jgi:hypothetical protein
MECLFKFQLFLLCILLGEVNRSPNPEDRLAVVISDA